MESKTVSGRLASLEEPTPTSAPVAGSGSIPASASSPALWHNRAFLIFWGGQGLASLGTMFALIAMPLLVFQATGQVVQMGLVTATFTTAQLVAGTFAGQLVDRFDRRRLMIACDASRALIFSSIPLVWWFFGPQVWLIYVVTASSAILGMIFQVGFVTAVANLVDKDQIITANGYINASMSVTNMVGPLLGGVAVEHLGPALALSVQAAAFAVSAVSLLLVRFRQIADEKQSQAGKQRGAEALAGMRFLFTQPVLCAVTCILLFYGLVIGAALDLFIYHLKTNLHQGGTAIGFVLAGGSIGAIIGSLMAGPARKRLGFGPTYLGAVALGGLPILAVSLVMNLYVVTALVALSQFAGMVMGINSMSLRQEITPNALLGRVTSAFWTISGVMTPIGAAAGTALAARIGAPATFVWIGLLVMLIGLAGIFSPARQRWPAGSALSDARQKNPASAVSSAEDVEAQEPQESQVTGV